VALGSLQLTVLSHHGKHHRPPADGRQDGPADHATRAGRGHEGRGAENGPAAHKRAHPHEHHAPQGQHQRQHGGQAPNPPRDPARIDPSRVHDLHQARGIIARLQRENEALTGQGKKVEALDGQLRESQRRKAFDVECARYPNRPHIYLNDDSYYNIGEADAAKMVGYFTQKLKMDGFPWELQRETSVGPFKVPRPVSEMEALQMLAAGEEVLFQPKRVVDLNLSPDAVGSLALLGTPAAPAAAAATLAKQGNVKIEGAGREIPYGKPVPVHSFGELKLLHEMYNPEAKCNKGNELADTSQKVAFFAMKRHNTPYPFAFYKASPGSRWTNAFKSLLTGGALGAVIGGVTGLILQGPIGSTIGVKVGMLAGAKLGAIGLGVYKGARELFVAQSKEEINTFEAVDRVTKGQTVIFQEKKMHSMSMLIFGKLTWFTDYGHGSEIHDKAELDVFHALQNQWPDEKKDDDKQA
jgi:hypothetical protein